MKANIITRIILLLLFSTAAYAGWDQPENEQSQDSLRSQQGEYTLQNEETGEILHILTNAYGSGVSADQYRRPVQ